MASEWLFPTNSESNERHEKSNNEELFVFGYACKLFRDDEQARMVDEGTYMIPWMGDDKLKIDRYDGRGHLYDLRPYDADRVKGLPAPECSEDEVNLERLCDEERYLELHTDLQEKSMYEEEEWKRYYESLSEGYKAVGFSYDWSTQQEQLAEPVADVKSHPDELPFTPPPEMQVPADIEIPSTVKENARIEKTAKFIAQHGVQMEIVMKTKQANNPSFLFMHFEDPLHPYYKHLVKMIKTKKYIPKSPVKQEQRDPYNESGEGDHEDGDHGYLHPTLITTARASPTPEPYKPVPMPKVSIHETPYGQLLQSFSKVNKDIDEKNKLKELKAEVKTEPSESGLPACVAQPVFGSSTPPPPGIEPVQLPGADGKVEVKSEPGEREGSDSSPARSSTSPQPQIVPPPPDAQPIIDRMAMYVAKNGEEFSIVVKSKKDPRFQFLETWHPHYAYYNFKRHLFTEEMSRERAEQEATASHQEQERAELMARGVKFTLKRSGKDAEGSSASLENKAVFGNDESTDEDSDGDGRERRSRSSANISGTSTPERSTTLAETKVDENMEKKIAEQRLRDRIAASAREKLSQVDKEAQKQLERKKKAAMFINLLKNKNQNENTEPEKPKVEDSKSPEKPMEKEKSSKHKKSSRHRSRDRSRSRSRSRDRKSHSKRSRSRSHGKSSKKKKRKRSITPPSAYVVDKRKSPLRYPPPPPPRYLDIRGRLSRSPSRGQSRRSRERSRSRGRSSKLRSKSRSPGKSKHRSKSRSPGRSKHRSKSRSPGRSKHRSKSRSPGRSKQSAKSRSPGRSKHRSKSRSPKRSKHRSKSRSPGRSRSKKKKRSRSPKSKDESSHRRSSHKKKKKKSKSSRSDDRKTASTAPSLPPVPEDSATVTSPVLTSSAVASPAGQDIGGATTENSAAENTVDSHGGATEEEMEEGETRESTPEPGQIDDVDDTDMAVSSPHQDDTSKRFPPVSADPLSEEESAMSPGGLVFPRRKSRSRSTSASSLASLHTRSRSASKSRSSSRSRSLSRSSSRSKSRSKSHSRSRSKSVSRSRSASPATSRGSCVRSRETTPASSYQVSREVTPPPSSVSREVNGSTSNSGEQPLNKNVSSYMLDRVRALLKASKESVRTEEDMFADDPS